MATYISDDPKLLDELFRKDGEGQLLVGYETGKEKPHAESSYMLILPIPTGKTLSIRLWPCSANNR